MASDFFGQGVISNSYETQTSGEVWRKMDLFHMQQDFLITMDRDITFRLQ